MIEPISYHRDVLWAATRRADLDKEENENSLRWFKKYKVIEDKLVRQIERAEAEGLDSFDAETFGE